MDITHQDGARADALRHLDEQLTSILSVAESLDEDLLSCHVALALDTARGLLDNGSGLRNGSERLPWNA